MLAKLSQAGKLLSEVIDAELYTGKAREVVEKYYDKLRKTIYLNAYSRVETQKSRDDSRLG